MDDKCDKHNVEETIGHDRQQADEHPPPSQPPSQILDTASMGGGTSAQTFKYLSPAVQLLGLIHDSAKTTVKNKGVFLKFYPHLVVHIATCLNELLLLKGNKTL